jgi:hypothetical protein
MVRYAAHSRRSSRPVSAVPKAHGDIDSYCTDADKIVSARGAEPRRCRESSAAVSRLHTEKHPELRQTSPYVLQVVNGSGAF